MTDIRYWLWLQKCLGEGARFKEILEDFGTVEALYESNILQWKMSPAIVPRQLDRLERYSLEDTQEILNTCRDNGWDIIGFDDARYPARLREIDNPPAVLYLEGTLPPLDDYVTVGIVGTRKASSYALRAAHTMSKGVALCGAVTVSGGAMGVDAAVHRGTLDAGGVTLAVLGCGFGTDYLQSNKELRRQIVAQGGALLTEYPPFTPAGRHTFPTRNRIISGLSLGVCVVEAGEKSGSLITAHYAYEQNRDVFAIPASIFDRAFLGTNKLIDDGATVATSPSILVEGYAERYPTLDMTKIKTVYELLHGKDDGSGTALPKEQYTFDDLPRERAQRVKKEEAALALTGDEKTVYAVMDDTLQSIDLIIENSALTPQRVLIALTMLEMKGLVDSAAGKRYRLNHLKG